MSTNSQAPPLQKECSPKTSSPTPTLTSSSKPTPPNPFLKYTGFANLTNLFLFLLTVGVFAIFCLFNFLTSLEDGHWMKPKPPGEQFWFRDGLMYLGMQVHLWSVLPAGILLPLQFLPIMRRKYIGLHRWSGMLLFIMLLVGDVAALTIARHSFGGTIDTQIAVIALSSLTAFSTYKAWSSIRNLHIDQHRAWVIRTWSYACSILTLRIFMIIIVLSIRKLSPDGYKSVSTCEEILFMYQFIGNSTSIASLPSRYPACAGYEKSLGDVYVVVNARIRRGHPEEVAALLNSVFGVSGWVAIVIHLVVTEWWLNWTREEGERLKKVSLARRKAMGWD